MALPNEIPLQVDLINIEDDGPKIVMGTLTSGNDQLTPPLYITVELQNLHLHNCLYDSKACHSLIPLVVMENMGLDITRPYKYLYSFDCNRSQCLGIINDLVVRMMQIPRKFAIPYPCSAPTSYATRALH